VGDRAAATVQQPTNQREKNEVQKSAERERPPYVLMRKVFLVLVEWWMDSEEKENA
jgi:hypothetical protein